MMKGDGQKGFTLIELLLVVAIVALLALLAVASYNSYIERAQRADVENTLFEISLYLERYYTTNGKYTGANIAEFTSKYYEIDAELNDKTFTLSATSAKGGNCSKLTMDEKNTKTPESCW